MKTLNKPISHPGGEQLTLLPEDSPANPTAWQEREKAIRMTAISGQKCLEQLERFDLVGSSAKTFLALLIGGTEWFSSKSKLTWKLRGTKSSRRLYCQLVVKRHRMSDPGFGLLPTPVKMDTGRTTILSKIDARRQRMKEKHNGKNGMNHSGNGFGVSLGEMLQRGLLPTPRANDAEKMGSISADKRNGLPGMSMNGLLPTPYKKMEAKYKLKKGSQSSDRNICASVRRGETADGTAGPLNIQYVEEMMGFPLNWLGFPLPNIEGPQLAPLETPLFPR